MVKSLPVWNEALTFEVGLLVVRACTAGSGRWSAALLWLFRARFSYSFSFQFQVPLLWEVASRTLA